MIPITRKELYLNRIVGNNEYETPEKPISEEEFFFAEILGEAVQAPEPLTRYQLYLAKIAGKNIEIPYPETRLEYFLARAAGMDVETPVPITREEIYWSNYTATTESELEGVPPLIFRSDGSALKNYRFYGATGGIGDYDEESGKYIIPVTIAGKNKFDGTLFSGYYTDSTMTSIGGVSGNYKSCKVYLSAGTYTFSCSVFVLIIRYITSDIYRSNPIGSKYTQEYTFTLANDSYVSLAFRNESNTAWDDSTTIQVELSQSATEYEPYYEPITTNLYLPEQIKKLGFEAEHIDYREQKMHKVRKNLLPVVATSKTVTGVTFTVNVDKSITCNGRNNGTSDIIFEFNQSGISLEIGRGYIISGCPEGGAMIGSYAIKCYNGSYWVYDDGHGAAFPALGNGIARPQIIIPRGVTVNNLTFYPMIRTADIEDDTYEPYIENVDLDVTLPTLPILSGTNTLTVGTEVQPSKVYLKGKIEEIPTRTVSYYSQDGSTLLGTETVESGGNASGLQDTPTKPDTEQYTYTFVGWSNTTNATTAMSGILNNITADKSVYAAFSEAARTYTVYFYNESTLLQTVTGVLYGGSATYTEATPTKSGYNFDGWSPSPTNILADTSCYAQFVEQADYITDSWATISSRSAAGTASNYYAVGDCKPVKLEGTMGTLALDTTLYVYILGFNHNSALEGNGISFGCFKTAATNGIDVCLVDSKYGSSDISGTKYFNMSHRGSCNYGGWKGSDMRYDILGSTDVQPSGYGSTPTASKTGYDATSTCATNPVANTLMSCLPSDLRAVMKPVKKYTDNKGNKSNTSANVTSSIDYLPLLSEFEIQGIRMHANRYEQNKQAQYAYYTAGNSKVKCQHSKTSYVAQWWCRSADYIDSYEFCVVNDGGGSFVNFAAYSCGVAPCFLV